MEIDDFLEEDASDGELAACGLAIELFTTAGALTLMAQVRMNETKGRYGSDEEAAKEVTRHFMELVLPVLTEKGVNPCLRAADLIAAVRDAVVDGIRWETSEQARLN